MTVLRSRPTLAASFLLAGLSCLPDRAAANEPGGTDERRAELSDAVFDGRVTGIERVEELNDREDLCRATVEIGSVIKRPELIGDGTVGLYFERPKDGRVRRGLQRRDPQSPRSEVRVGPAGPSPREGGRRGA